jgi:hypothetical protein
MKLYILKGKHTCSLCSSLGTGSEWLVMALIGDVLRCFVLTMPWLTIHTSSKV